MTQYLIFYFLVYGCEILVGNYVSYNCDILTFKFICIFINDAGVRGEGALQINFRTSSPI